MGEDLQNWIFEEGKKKRKNEMQPRTDGITLSRWHSSTQAVKKTIEGVLERLRRVQIIKNNNDNLKQQQRSNKMYKSNSSASATITTSDCNKENLKRFACFQIIYRCIYMCMHVYILLYSCFSFVMDRFLFWLLPKCVE